jgi:hypothetical protein
MRLSRGNQTLAPLLTELSTRFSCCHVPKFNQPPVRLNKSFASSERPSVGSFRKQTLERSKDDGYADGQIHRFQQYA